MRVIILMIIMEAHEAERVLMEMAELETTLQYYRDAYGAAMYINTNLREERLKAVQQCAELECELLSKDAEVANLGSKLNVFTRENEMLREGLRNKEQQMKLLEQDNYFWNKKTEFLEKENRQLQVQLRERDSYVQKRKLSEEQEKTKLETEMEEEFNIRVNQRMKFNEVADQNKELEEKLFQHGQRMKQREQEMAEFEGGKKRLGA